MVNAFNASTWQAEAGGSLRFRPVWLVGLQSKFRTVRNAQRLSWKTKQKTLYFIGFVPSQKCCHLASLSSLAGSVLGLRIPLYIWKGVSAAVPYLTVAQRNMVLCLRFLQLSDSELIRAPLFCQYLLDQELVHMFDLDCGTPVESGWWGVVEMCSSFYQGRS